MSNVKLFVYGTLMRGQLAQDLLEGARFIAEDTTEKPAFELRNWGRFPALYTSGNDQVTGEIFEVPEDLMETLDRYESGIYEFLDIKTTNHGFCKAYMRKDPPEERRGVHIPGGDWRYR